MSSRDKKIAQELSDEGEAFSLSLRDDNRWYFENLKNTYFSIAAAISLTWTKHALYEDEFIAYAAGYIDGQIPKDLSMSNKFRYRFGADELENALTNYRKYYRHVKDIMPNFNRCDVHDINRLQQRLLSKLNNLRNERVIDGIGPWLFTGPFKIILSDQDRMWNQDGINAIVLPTGIEVDKGIKRLIKENFSFVSDFDVNWLKADKRNSNSLLDDYATYNMVHTHISNIGKITSTPAIHINSALYLYGRGDI